MAVYKVSGLTQTTAPQPTDLFYVSQPSGSGYASRKLTYADLLAKLQADGVGGGARSMSILNTVTSELSHGAFWSLTNGGILSNIFNCRKVINKADNPVYSYPLYTPDGVNSYVIKVKSTSWLDDGVTPIEVKYLADDVSGTTCPQMMNAGGSGTSSDPYVYAKAYRLNKDAALTNYKWVKERYCYAFLPANMSCWLDLNNYRSADGWNPDFHFKFGTGTYYINSVAGRYGSTI